MITPDAIYLFELDDDVIWADTDESYDSSGAYIKADSGTMNEIKARAIEDAINACPFYTMETTMESSTITVRINDLKECAERLRSTK